MSDVRPIEDLFGELIELETSAEREEYLDRVCGSDAQLRDQLEKLLADHERAGSFLDVSEPLDATEDWSENQRPSEQIGPYKLREQIGEGGMGVVYVAEQKEPLRRKVALKVIKPGMDSKAVIARFDAERNALALMNHPNIAKVLDAGTTRQGRPYFVMELVSGVPITEYCDEHKLTIRERLGLFISVCQAIQHAHQKGIIHRDVKPSNVLVTELDGKPIPIVIDFGIAKALNQTLSERSIYTSFQSVIGTPLYMSPEQAKLSAVDVDTRSDVYSLGVLLYELLAGTTPFEWERFEHAAMEEACRIVREEEPPKPSTKIGSIGETATSVSLKRKTDPSSLGRTLRGDLDLVVMKAIEKDRSRRYTSASHFAADVLRFLEDQPVEARSPGTLYRLTKFAKRNTAMCGVFAAALAGLVTIAIVSTTMWMIIANKETQVRKQRYSSDVARALELWSEGSVDSARRLLERNESDLRDVSWRCVWNLCEQNHRIPFMPLNSRILDATTCPAENLVAVSLSGGEVLLIDSTNQGITDRFPFRVQNWLTGPVALSSDGSMLAYPGGVANSFRIRNLSITPPSELSFATSAPVSSAKFVEDSGTIAIGCGRSVEIRRVDDVRVVQRIDLPDLVRRVEVSPKGRHLAVGMFNSAEVHLWDLNKVTDSSRVFRHDGPINKLTFSHDDGLLATSSRDHTVRVWSVSSEGQVAQFRAVKDEVKGMAFSLDNKYLLGGTANGLVYCWHIETRQLISTVRTHNSTRGLAYISPDSLVAFGGRKIQFWPSRVLQHPGIRRRQRQIREVKFLSEDNIVFYELGGQTVQRVDLTTSEEHTLISDPEQQIWAMAVSPDKKLVAIGGLSGTIRVFDSATASERHKFSTAKSVRSLAFSPDAKYLGSNGDNGLHVWELPTGRPVRLNHQQAGGQAIACSDKFLATGNNDGEIEILGLTSRERWRIRAHSEDVLCLAFSPSGNMLVSGSLDGTIRTWDVLNERSLVHEIDNQGMVWCVEFTKDGASLLSDGPANQVYFWDLDTLERRFAFPPMHGYAKCLAISPSGNGIVAGTFSGDIQYWDVSPSE